MGFLWFFAIFAASIAGRKTISMEMGWAKYGLGRVLLTENGDQIWTRLDTGNGVHTVEMEIGQQKRTLIVDTGSGDTAFVCDSCQDCGTRHRHLPYKLTANATYWTCAMNAQRGFKRCHDCANDRCAFKQKYVEGSGWNADKVEDSIQFKNKVANVVFGCIKEEYGEFAEQESDGIMGMSREYGALYAQLYRQGVIPENSFSQCIAKDGGAMVLGGMDHRYNLQKVQYTPVRFTKYTYWTVVMQSVTINGGAIHVAQEEYNKERGCVLDSGTTFVYLPKSALMAFQQQWKFAVGFMQYTPGKTYTLTKSQLLALPEVCFHLDQGAAICMSPKQYMVHRNEMNRYTATIYFKDFAHATIIGASALAHHNVLYDLQHERIGIAPANCDATFNGTIALATTEANSMKFWIYVIGICSVFGAIFLKIVSWQQTRNQAWQDAQVPLLSKSYA